MNSGATPSLALSARGLIKVRARGSERFEMLVPEIDLEAGRVTAIIGDSGSGKSTLLDMLALISAPDEAESLFLQDGAEQVDVMTLWRGRRERRLSALRRRIGLVLQTGGLIPFLDVAGNAKLARALAAMPEDASRIFAAAEELGVRDRLATYPATLSGGERQRAAILRALAHDPALLIADEPTAAVDRFRAEVIIEELGAQVEQRGAAAVIVSHDAALVEQVADRVYRLDVERVEDGVSRAVCRQVARAPRRGAAAGLSRQITAEAAETVPARPDRTLPLRLAWTDLTHDLRFSLASIAAIAAVIAPLLLLFGLKFGVVAHQVERLTQDPRSRELTPLKAVTLTPEVLARWRARPDIAFVTPGIARGASGAALRVVRPGRRQERLVDLLATQPGDPLLLENGAPVPGEGEIVLSHEAAVALARGGSPTAMRGQQATLAIARRLGGRRQVSEAEVRIVGVLDPRADPLERVYANFSLVSAVERYRSGVGEDLATAATARGAPVTPVYDALLAVAPAAAAETTFWAAARAVGAAAPRAAEPPGADDEAAGAPRRAALLRAPGAVFGESALATTGGVLAEAGGVVLGVVDPIEARLELPGFSQRLRVAGAPDAEAARQAGARPVFQQEAGSGRAPIAVPAAVAPIGAEGLLLVEGVLGAVETPVLVEAHADGAFLPLRLAAQLRAGRDRVIAFDAEAGVYRIAEQRYRGFRMYARSIFDVEALHRILAAQGVDTAARLGPIRTIREIDAALSTLLALVGAIGVGGAFAAMAANLISTVERKRADIGMLRVMGLSRRGAFVLPVAQGALIGLGAGLVAVSGFLAIASPINYYLADLLPFGERICHVPPHILATSVAATTIAASFCALFAARRAARVDPATALRRE